MGMHTHYKRGTPLYIIMKSGETIEGKFFDHGSGNITLADGKKIDLGDVRSVSIRRLPADTNNDPNKPQIKWRKDY